MEKTYINDSLGFKLTFKTYEHDPQQFKMITHYSSKINCNSFNFYSWLLKVLQDWAQMSGIEFDNYLKFESNVCQLWKFKPGYYAELLKIVDENSIIPK